MKKVEEMVVSSAPEAASFRTDIRGWVSRTGRFFGEGPDAEDLARWEGATHTPCARCGGVVEKPRLHCSDCAEIDQRMRYLTRELVEWDGKTPLFSLSCEEYLRDSNEVADFVAELPEGEKVNLRVRLVPCVPITLRPVELSYWADNLPEDSDGNDLPEDFLETLDSLNAIAANTIASWEPGERRVNLPDLR